MGYACCSEGSFEIWEGFVFVNVEKWDHLRTFELKQLVYLVEQRNKCKKVAVGKITGRPTLENFHNVPIVEGWYHVWIMEPM